MAVSVVSCIIRDDLTPFAGDLSVQILETIADDASVFTKNVRRVGVTGAREVKRKWLQAVSERSGLSRKEFSDTIGVAESVISGMLNGHRAVSDDTVDKVIEKFDATFAINEMPTMHGAYTLAEPPAPMLRDNIVCVDVSARAGYVEGYGDRTYLTALPTYRVPDLPPGRYRDFAVEGFSMHNPATGQIHPGSHVIAEEVTDPQNIRQGRVYVVVTSNDVLVKRLFRQDHTFVLKSDSPDRETYPDIQLPVHEVRELWHVRQLRTDKIPPPSGNTERVMDLERRLAELELQLSSRRL